jgi:Putative zinc-finger
VLSCRHITRLLSEALDRRLSWLERLAVGIHLWGCRPCRRFRRAIRWVHAALQAAPSDARLSPPARARLQRAVEEALGES